jgi:hypothetical protein
VYACRRNWAWVIRGLAFCSPLASRIYGCEVSVAFGDSWADLWVTTMAGDDKNEQGVSFGRSATPKKLLAF